MPNKKEKYVIALEPGSSRAKIGLAAFVPDDPNHTLTVHRVVSLPAVDSIRYGRITNIREVTEIVTNLVESVERKHPIDDRNIEAVFISIGGRTLKSHKVSARIVLPERREITEDLIERLQDEALDKLTTAGELVYVEPVRFNVDNMPTPRPVGTMGTRLAGEFTAVVCHPSNKADLVDVVSERIKLGINGASVRPIALAHLVLSPQETNAGCMLVDFGAETITVSIYKKYALQYLVTIPLGSRLITRDLASTLALTEEEAENLKLGMANAMPERGDAQGVDRQTLDTLNAVVSARVADIVANICAQPGFAGMKAGSLPAGIILTGGGSNLRNFARLLEVHSQMKVRLATLPNDIIINDPDVAAIDNLDIIALLNDGAELMRLDPKTTCVSPAKPRSAQRPASGTNVGPEVIFDINSADDTTDEGTDTPDDNFGYSGQAFNYDYEDENDRDFDPGYEDDENDPNWMLSDDEVEERNQLDYERQVKMNEKAKALQAKREKEEAKRQRQAERDKQRAEERARKRANQKPSRISILSRRISNTLTNILNSDDEDNSGDMD